MLEYYYQKIDEDKQVAYYDEENPDGYRPDGDIKVVLGNYQNKNLTTVDGLPIETGDEIRLTDGNAITMGQTTVTIKIY